MINARTPISALGVLTLVTMAALPARAALFTFETDPASATTPFSSTSSGLTATFAGSTFADPAAFQISYNSSSGPVQLYKGLNVSFLATSLYSLDPSSPLTITFSAPVSALSLNFALGDASGSLALSTDTGATASALGAVPSGYRYAEGVLSYAGAAFTVATLRTGASGLAIDNVNATAASVPEPATLALLGTGLAGLVLRRRRA